MHKNVDQALPLA